MKSPIISFIHNKKFKRVLHLVNVILFAFFLAFAFTETITIIPKYGEKFPPNFFISIVTIPVFALSYFVLYRNDASKKIIYGFLFLFLILSISSFVMAVCLNYKYSGYFSTNPIKVYLEIVLKYAYDIACLIYVFCMLKQMSKKILNRGLVIYLWAMLVFTLFQFVTFKLNNDTMYSIYDKVNFLGLFQPSSLMRRLNAANQAYRAYGFSGEPGHNCILLSCIAIPVLTIDIFRKDNVKKSIGKIILLAFVLFFALMTKSPAVYMGLIINIIFIFYFIIKKGLLSKKTAIIFSLLVFGIIILLFIIPATRDILTTYLSKILNLTNQSTASHYSLLYNDTLVFIKFPLFGIGDGMQGYFYFSHVANSIFAQAYEVQSMLRGEIGLIEGGAGIPTILSSYGIFGILVIFILMKRFYINIVHYNQQNKFSKLYILISMVSLFVLLCVRTGFHRNYPLAIVFALQYSYCDRFIDDSKNNTCVVSI